MTGKTDRFSNSRVTTNIARFSMADAIRLWGLIVLTLHLAAWQLPEESAWSLWPYSFLPPWLGWLLALLAGALAIPAVNQAVLTRLQQVAQLIARQLQILRVGKRGGFILIALGAGLLFWLFRLRHLRWGDSYLLSVALSYPDLELRVIYNWQAPFTVFLHQRLWQFVVHPLLGWPVETVYATVSIICGIIFVYLLLQFSSRLGRNPAETVIIAGLILTTGSMQLFFGYVENYTLVSLGLLVTLFLVWRTVQEASGLLWPVLALSLTNAFHPSTVFLWPGLVLLAWLTWKRGRVWPLKGLLQLVGPPLLVGSSVLALMESGGHGLSALLGVDRPGGGDGIWFVPLFETTTRWQHYTMFSGAHLLDWSNIHFLISPFGLPLLAIGLAAWYCCRPLFNSRAEKEFASVLGLMAGMYILLTWLWNPDYGGRKDWDLFAPSAFVYTLLAGYLLGRLLPHRQQLKETGLFLIAVSLLHTAAWIFTNTHNLPLN